MQKRIIDKKFIENTKKDAEREIEEAVLKFESTKLYNPEEIFNYMYQEKTEDLKEQQKEIKSIKLEEKEIKKGEKSGVVGELEEA